MMVIYISLDATAAVMRTRVVVLGIFWMTEFHIPNLNDIVD